MTLILKSLIMMCERALNSRTPTGNVMNITAKPIFWLAALAWLAPATLISSPSFALQEPRPIATDHRIQTVRYDPNEVFKFTSHYGFQSSIEFEADEEINTISLGDSLAWMVTPSNNRLFIKPIEQNALTNMTVVTNKRTYHLELHAEETNNIRSDQMVFVMRFDYPASDLANIELFTPEDDIPDIYDNPQNYNFAYTYRGSELIAPIRIFDDGEFTYLEFRDMNADLPAVFDVDVEGNESIVNFRKRGDYMVIERVSNIMTLRNGIDIVCVFNERGIQAGVKPYKPTFWERNNPF